MPINKNVKCSVNQVIAGHTQSPAGDIGVNRLMPRQNVPGKSHATNRRRGFAYDGF